MILSSIPIEKDWGVWYADMQMMKKRVTSDCLGDPSLPQTSGEPALRGHPVLLLINYLKANSLSWYLKTYL
jgi:hypothetical protein